MCLLRHGSDWCHSGRGKRLILRQWTIGLAISWWSLGKYIHNDHVAGLIVHYKVEHMSSHLVGIEIHGVIALVELVCVILYSACIGLNYLVESTRPSNGRISNQLNPGSDRAYHILCPACCSLDPEFIGPGWHCGNILVIWQRLAGAVIYHGRHSLRYIELDRGADYSAYNGHTRGCIIFCERRERGVWNPLVIEGTACAVPGEARAMFARDLLGLR
jgi:hypothetical protein